MSVIMSRRWVLASWLRMALGTLKTVVVLALAGAAVLAFLRLPAATAFWASLRGAATATHAPASAATAGGSPAGPAAAAEPVGPAAARVEGESRPQTESKPEADAKPETVQGKPAPAPRRQVARRKPAEPSERGRQSWGFGWLLRWPDWFSGHRTP